MSSVINTFTANTIIKSAEVNENFEGLATDITSLETLVSTDPTVQKFTSGSGTYTTPAGVKYIRVRMVGGGGGGSGSGTASSSSDGTAGGNTTFGTSLLVANGGAAGLWAGFTPPAGGSASLGTGPVGLAIAGGRGAGSSAPAASGIQGFGGSGGVSIFGGAGNGGLAAGQAAVTNSGSGGGGGGMGGVANCYSGAGGGSGGFVDAIITSPDATYAYAVGAAGAAGAAGTNGNAGGNGGSGIIIVEEYY